VTITNERAGERVASGVTATRRRQTLQSPHRDATQYRFWRRLRRHKLGMLGLAMLVALVIAAVFAPMVAGKDPAAMAAA
jgi:ABC-type antimicrobial peptide transport system permease subunit